jgi:hypothetical protein
MKILISQEQVSRTIIVYMAADNDLDADALADIEEMKQGFSEKGVNLMVFIDPLDEVPYLLKIGNGKETYIKSYSELNSADPAILKQIIQEVITMYPAQEYGLILWSHGTSWLPARAQLRSFGKDKGNEMNLPDLDCIFHRNHLYRIPIRQNHSRIVESSNQFRSCCSKLL